MEVIIITSVDPKELYKFKKAVKELKSKRGRHTELVSVYVPPGYEISKVVAQLKDEQGTASNIKSKSTKKNVITALEKIIQHLRLHSKTPDNGLAVFCGNVSEREGIPDFQIYPIIPVFPLSNRIYRCSQVFVLEPLVDMLNEFETYGLLVMDRGGATLALLKGKRVEILKDIKSMVPGKFRAGGQSAARFERVRENLANDFYKRVGSMASEAFKAVDDLNGILVGGPGPTKESFVQGEFLDHDLLNKIIGIKDLSYTDEWGIQELVERSDDVLAEADVTKEKKLVNEFLARLAQDAKVTYGEEMVRQALIMGSVDIVLLSEKINWFRTTIKCGTCGFTTDGTVKDKGEFENKVNNQKCPKCGESRFEITEEQDLVENLEEMCEASGASLELISAETSEGAQLLELGGIGALLRY